jgi:glycosyltransferase involved in cell wall biosynthesis
MSLRNLEFMGAVKPAEVPSLLRGLDIGIATLRNTELFKAARPTKLFEYMEAGLPILCAIDGEARRFVEDVGAGVSAKPEDAQDVTRAVLSLASDEKARHSMGMKGRQYIQQHASRKRLAERLQSILTSICTRSRATL